MVLLAVVIAFSCCCCGCCPVVSDDAVGSEGIRDKEYCVKHLLMMLALMKLLKADFLSHCQTF